jgi:hypothetical protein
MELMKSNVALIPSDKLTTINKDWLRASRNIKIDNRGLGM